MKTKNANRELLIAHLREEVWALPIQTLSLIWRGVMDWPDMEWAAAFGRQPSPPSRQGTIALVPIHGMIAQRSSILDEFFGVSSLDSTRAAIRVALADPNVRAILLDLDTPGGSVAGVTELAGEIRDARGQGKPIIAHANTLAASAGYWLASQADEVIVSPSGSVGSIGIIAIHQDVSRALDAEGITTTLIASGQFKTEGNPFEPLTDEAKGHLQERSDAHYAQFVADVAKARGTTAENVRSTYGQGRIVMARQALAAGMVDRVEPFDATIARLSKANGGAQPVEARAEGDDADMADPMPFHERVAALARESQFLADHGTERARLRSKEGRRPFSQDTSDALRSSRDAITALLASVEPESSAGSAPPVDPDPSPEAAPPTAKPVTLRPISREDFLVKLTKEPARR